MNLRTLLYERFLQKLWYCECTPCVSFRWWWNYGRISFLSLSSTFFTKKQQFTACSSCLTRPASNDRPRHTVHGEQLPPLKQKTLSSSCAGVPSKCNPRELFPRPRKRWACGSLLFTPRALRTSLPLSDEKREWAAISYKRAGRYTSKQRRHCPRWSAVLFFISRRWNERQWSDAWSLTKYVTNTYAPCSERFRANN